jgi:hypothetical protein
MSEGEKVYYHGTETRRAYDIMTQGFKVGEEAHGRMLGDRSFVHWDSDEILVFNPSRVRPLSAHRLYSDEESERVTISAAIELAALKEISAKAQEEYEEEE